MCSAKKLFPITSKFHARMRVFSLNCPRYFVGAQIEKGEWDPYWDRVKSATTMREPKGKICERKQAAR